MVFFLLEVVLGAYPRSVLFKLFSISILVVAVFLLRDEKIFCINNWVIVIEAVIMVRLFGLLSDHLGSYFWLTYH